MPFVGHSGPGSSRGLLLGLAYIPRMRQSRPICLTRRVIRYSFFYGVALLERRNAGYIFAAFCEDFRLRLFKLFFSRQFRNWYPKFGFNLSFPLQRCERVGKCVVRKIQLQKG